MRDRRRGRLRLDLGDGPPVPDPERRRRRRADARGLDRARASSRRTTKRARIGLMVGGIHYREPGIWVKAATTLDVLSGGRAWLGLGAAWNQEESRGARVRVPAARRAVRDARGDAPDRARDVRGRARLTARRFEGRHYRPTRLLNSPQSISRPRVPIMIGGGGEQKTLRLVAQYGDACERLRRAGEDPPQVGGPPAPLRGASGDRTTRSSARRSRAFASRRDGVGRQRDAGPGHRTLRRARRRRRPARPVQRPRRLADRTSWSSSGRRSSRSCAMRDRGVASFGGILPGGMRAW